MCLSMWYLSVVALLAAEVRTAALDNTKHIEPYRCHHCLSSNKTRCAVDLPIVLCPVEHPYCATVADVPNFTQSLTCASFEKPCLLSNKENGTFQITCICIGHLCNTLYNSELRGELLKFITKFPNSTSSDLTEMFLNSSVYANVSKDKLYEAITIGQKEKKEHAENITQLIVTSNDNLMEPRAEALKNPATVPPDDDEDESEGSGLEENKSQLPAAPAAPSSFLPSEQNHASQKHKNILLPALILYLTLLCNKSF